MNMRSLRIEILSICALALGACANTQLISSWRDPDVSSVRFRKVLAVAMTTSDGRRHAIEDRMVMDIEAGGALAVASYSLVPIADTRNLAVVKAAVLGGGFDGAVTWQATSIRDVTRYVPGTYVGFWGYYDMGWAMAYDPGYLRTERIIRVATKVYLVTEGSDRLIWSGTSRTVDPASLDALVDGVADATVDSMRGSGMLAARR
jgi:hypothetical protein